MVSYNERDLKYFKLGVNTGIDQIYKVLITIGNEQNEDNYTAEKIIEFGEELRYLLGLRTQVLQDLEIGSS